MSGSIAAIAAYDGTGTQGYQTTDKTIPGVKSIFWNENDTDKYYVNGSALIEIPVNNSEITFNNTQPAIFTFPNDADAVGAIYIHGTVNTPVNLGISGSQNNNTNVIDFIELCVGNQIIVSKNFSEIYSIYSNLYSDYGSPITGKTKFALDLNLMSYIFNTSSNGLNFSYLMACANNQTLRLKIYPSTSATLSAQGFGTTSWDSVNFEVFSRVYSMVNDERNFLRNQVIPKLFPVTQYADRVTVPSSPSPESPIIVNCDSFNIDAQSISIFIPGSYNSGTIGFDVELFLNSSSYSGLVPFMMGQSFVGIVDETPIFRLNLATAGTIPATDFHKSELVPLSKYDSIRVYIYLQSGAPNTQSDIDILKNGITVVANGYCTALYQNGAVSFNNY